MLFDFDQLMTILPFDVIFTVMPISTVRFIRLFEIVVVTDSLHQVRQIITYFFASISTKLRRLFLLLTQFAQFSVFLLLLLNLL